MPIEDIATINISRTSSAPTREGFGVLLFAAYHLRAAGRVLEVTSPEDVVAAGFAVTEEPYLVAQKYFGQSPRPKKMLIGRRGIVHTQRTTIKIASLPAVGEKILLTFQATPINLTRTAPDTTSTLATALAAAINAVAAASASAATDTVTVTAVTPGLLYKFSEWSSTLQLETTNVDPGITADLTAIAAERNDWYGLALDSQSKAEVLAAAAWTESAKKFLMVDTIDAPASDAVATTDVLSQLKTSAYFRTLAVVSGRDSKARTSIALFADRSTVDPGSDTWEMKTLASVAADSDATLSPAKTSAIKAKNGGYYLTIAGVNLTQNTKTAGGEWCDVVRGLDWFASEGKVRLLTLFSSAEKVPYTDAGVDKVRATIGGLLSSATESKETPNNLFAANPAPTFEAPLVASVDSITKKSRVLPTCIVRAELAGAIHAVNMTAYVTG